MNSGLEELPYFRLDWAKRVILSNGSLSTDVQAVIEQGKVRKKRNKKSEKKVYYSDIVWWIFLKPDGIILCAALGQPVSSRHGEYEEPVDSTSRIETVPQPDLSREHLWNVSPVYVPGVGESVGTSVRFNAMTNSLPSWMRSSVETLCF